MPDIVQRVIGLGMLVALSPVLVLLALAVRLDSPGPILYRARRVGRGGLPFTCLKFRTMTWQPRQPGPSITVSEDSRVTRVGRVFRRLRIDELPQLLNVARGELRLVGPRPEDPRFVDLANPLHRRVFTAMPGITGLAQLLFLDEARLLSGTDPERSYRVGVLPVKLEYDARYLANRSARLDLLILAGTAAALFGWRPTTDLLERWAPKPLPDLTVIDSGDAG